MFYANLFEADPSLQPLFSGDMSAQGAKLMQMIAVAVSKLGQPGHADARIAGPGPAGMRAMASQDQHYDTVGAALLKTLRQGLGVAFTPEVEAAWAEVYGCWPAR